MSDILSGKVALVTGGGTGLGAATALAFAEAGAKVAISGRRKSRLDEVVAGIAALGGEAFAVVSDVSKEADATAAVDTAAQHFGRLDIVVNSAGVNEAGGIEGLGLEGWHKVIDINLYGTIYTCKAAVPHLKAAGGGDIVNVSSTSGRRGAALFASYSTSKHGVNGFSESIRQELGPQNIRVSIVEPGATESEIAESISDPTWREAINAHVTKAGAMKAEDIAATILFIVGLPRRACVPQIQVRPTIDVSAV